MDPLDQALLTASSIQTVASVLAIVLAVLGVYLAVRGIQIAQQTAKDQKENREFPGDKAAADECRAELAAQGPLLENPGAAGEEAASRIREACDRFSSIVTDGHIISFYISRRCFEIDSAVRTMEANRWDTDDLAKIDEFEKARIATIAYVADLRLHIGNWGLSRTQGCRDRALRGRARRGRISDPAEARRR